MIMEIKQDIYFVLKIWNVTVFSSIQVANLRKYPLFLKAYTFKKCCLKSYHRLLKLYLT